MRRRIQNGFTIVELLVVIAIIAAIMAILLPGLGKARAVARRTVCASNLKQIDIAMHSYLSINDDTYPAAQDPVRPGIWLWMGRGWRKFLMPHLGGKIDANNPSVLWCPQDQASKIKYESTSYDYSMAFYHSPEQIDTLIYTANHAEQWDGNSIPPIPQRNLSVAHPSGKIIIGEWYSNHLRLSSKDPGWWGWAGKRNYLFADGHVHLIDANDVIQAHDGCPNPNVTLHGIGGIDFSP
jgi:prepilin-type N-terminal cleavage/methylation domain-containing protein/prepilin-type processing-associated H-X9-DG protein